MILDDDSWLLCGQLKVLWVCWCRTQTTPISDKEVQAIMKFVTQEQQKFKAKFSIVKRLRFRRTICRLLGTIEAIDDERGKVRVLVFILT
jgi:transcription antitermination factor NusG